MFKVETPYHAVPILGTSLEAGIYAIDGERGYALVPGPGLLRGNGQSQVLVVGDKLIPFDCWWERHYGPDGRITSIDVHFSPLKIGSSPSIERFKGIGSFSFGSEQQKQQLVLLAAEALLVFSAYNSEDLHKVDGRITVYAGDTPYTRRSFGYPTES